MKSYYALIILGLSLLVQPVTLANPDTNQGSSTQSELPPAPRRGTPTTGNPTPGVTRPQATCPETPHPLTAIFSDSQQDFTLSEHPSFWFYVPYPRGQIQAMEFILLDEAQRQTIYRTRVQPPPTPGVIRVSLPNDPEYTLASNQNYHWYLMVDCEQSEEPGLVVNGWIQRRDRSAELAKQFETLNPNAYLAPYALYLDHGYWYDAIDYLAQRRVSNPDNQELARAWESLVKSLGFEWVAQQPFVQAESQPLPLAR